MADKTESTPLGEALQIVKPGEDHTFVLDEEALSRLLLREDVRERAVVVVSVAGAFRKGKSFLLDFFIRYLHHKYVLNGTGDWLGAPDAPLRGFPWRGGSERHTTGLLLWSPPFLATLDTGEKVVFLLMDTQGTFDSESTVRDCATIFALSTLLSTVQVYNLSQNIEEDDLQHLQLFTEYGRLAQQTQSEAAFQSLVLLVRDWSFPYDHPYGEEGGKSLLDKRLEVREGQHPELQSVRRHVRGCFRSVSCCLLPHPGLAVATSPHFDGRVSDISPEFISCLRSLVPRVVSAAARGAGRALRARDWALYLRAYLQLFNGTELPEPKSILEATAEANNLSALGAARDVYDTLMEAVCGADKPYLPTDRLEEEHRRAKDKAVHSFNSKRKMGGDERAQTYCDQLVQELEDTFVQLRGHNEAKNLSAAASTAIVLIFACAAGAILSALLGGAGADTAAGAAQALAIVAGLLLVVWMYTRITGNMREVGMRIDEAARVVKLYVLQYVVDPYQRAPADGAHLEKKQS